MVLIVGAGPCGLSAGYHLKSQYTIIESSGPAGLCRSFSLGGFSFDYGGHAFFTRNAEVRQLYESSCSTGVYYQRRSAWVWIDGHVVPYPFQANLFGLPMNIVIDCLNGLFDAYRDFDDSPAENLRDHINRTFGTGIANHFMIPYNTKLWAYPLEHINPSWTAERIVAPNVNEIIEGAVRRTGFYDFANNTVGYPTEGGFEVMFAGLVERVRPQMIQGRINRISLKGHWAETEDGRRFAYDALVSTMPLVKLVAIIEEQPEELLQELPSFLHNSLHLVSLVVDRPNITDMQRLYVADPGIPFHKLVFNSNSSPSMKNHPNGFPIQAEVSFSPNKNVPAIGLTERVIEGLHQVGILNKDDSVIESDLRTIRYAYPVLTKEVARSRQRVKDYLLNYDVYCGGRFGEWLYINSDTAVARGMELADVINGNLAHS